MRIVEVNYSLESRCDEGGVCCSACAVVDEGESPDLVFDELRQWVHQQASLSAEVEQLAEKKRSLEGDITCMELHIKRVSFVWQEIEMQWEKAKAFLEQHGLEVTAQLPAAPSFDLEEEFE